MFSICLVANTERAPQAVFNMLGSMQHRKTRRHSVISLSEKGEPSVIKIEGIVFNSANLDRSRIESLRGRTAFGLGVRSGFNVHVGSFQYRRFVLLASGSLFESPQWRQVLSSDDEASVWAEQMIREGGGSGQDLHQIFLNFLSRHYGVYSSLLWYQEKITIASDPYGFMPLTLARMGDSVVCATETCSLDLLGVNKSLWRHFKPGQWVQVDITTGKMREGQLDLEKEVPVQHCALSFIYGLRPDSEAFGISPAAISTALARCLAEELDDSDFEVVVPIPDSGIPIAQELASYLKIPFKTAILRNHYLHSALDSEEVKFSVVKDLVRGKKVLLVGTSILQGRTVKLLIRLLRSAGAAEVHVVMGPEIIRPCPAKLSFAEKNRLADLISSQKSSSQICEHINADSLTFLSLGQFLSGFNPYGPERFCFHCFGISSAVFPT